MNKISSILRFFPEKFFVFSTVCLLLLSVSSPALSHFGVLLPSSNQVDQKQPDVKITFAFLHPFEQTGMDLDWPESVFVYHDETKTDLKGTMLETTALDHRAWKCSYKPARPGTYWFLMETAPYWEEAEDIFIIHYTKSLVSAYGGDQGWEKPVGVKTEIVPLTRPFANYSGNSFTGTVLFDGAPAPGVDVEVELFNEEKWIAPSDAHITQVVRTDVNGNFTFTCPLPGWWGFSALSEADYTIKGPDGKEKQVELGAVLWVKFDPNPYLGQ